MKTNVILSFLVSFALALVSCEKNDTSPATAEIDTEETALADFLLAATLNINNARTATNTGTNSDTTSTGSGRKKCNLTEIEESALLEAVTSYISTTYAVATIERAGTTSEGEVLVHIQKTDGSYAVLLFDASGTFVSERSHKSGKPMGTPVEVVALPETISTYVASNYAGAAVEKAMQSTEGNYVVLLNKTDGTMLGLAFDAEGNFINELTMKGKFGGKGRGPGRK
jgi:hypothetical protein